LLKRRAEPEVGARAVALVQQSRVAVESRSLPWRSPFLLAAAVFFLVLAFPLLFDRTVILQVCRMLLCPTSLSLISAPALACDAASFLAKHLVYDFLPLLFLQGSEISLVSETV
jgi:hypothetical protein